MPMKCPFCDYLGTKVLDSRPANDYKSIRRRRECENCQRRFTTFETVEETPDTIITLTTGKKFVVRESAADVVSSVRSYMRQIGAFPLSVKSHDLEDIR